MYKGGVYKKGTFVRLKRDLSDKSNFQTTPADAEMTKRLQNSQYNAERVIL